jgi:IPT/TIG domain
VVTPGGTSPTSSVDQFTFVAAPTVTGLSPTTGPAAGGTLVTITGTGFTGATAVDFGTTAATSFTVVNATTITAVTPPGAGTVGVTVITPAGTSSGSSANQFAFVVAPPTVVSLVRFGFHMQQTSLVLEFSTALAATPAENVNNYQILTMDGQVIPVNSAVYDPATLTVTLVPTQRLSLDIFYQLTVNGTAPNGLTGATGVLLDGAGNGAPGSNFVRMFSGGILVGASPALKVEQPKRFAAEQAEFAAERQSWATEPRRVAAAHKGLAIARNKMAVAQKKLAAQLRVADGPTATDVDALAASGKLTAKPKAVRIHVGKHHPRG